MDRRLDLVSVRLTKKLADALDGIDLAGCRVGDVLRVSRPEARLLIAEGWAVAVSRNARDADFDDGTQVA